LPSGATSIPIGPLASLTRIVRRKLDHTVPEQSDFLPSPATQRTPPTICFTSSLSPPFSVYDEPKWPMPLTHTRPSLYGFGAPVPSATASPS
jgi:hypothetical protein